MQGILTKLNITRLFGVPFSMGVCIKVLTFLVTIRNVKDILNELHYIIIFYGLNVLLDLFILTTTISEYRPSFFWQFLWSIRVNSFIIEIILCALTFQKDDVWEFILITSNLT